MNLTHEHNLVHEHNSLYFVQFLRYLSYIQYIFFASIYKSEKWEKQTLINCTRHVYYFFDKGYFVTVCRIHQEDEEVMENICALFCELLEYGMVFMLKLFSFCMFRYLYMKFLFLVII